METYPAHLILQFYLDGINGMQRPDTGDILKAYKNAKKIMVNIG